MLPQSGSGSGFVIGSARRRLIPGGGGTGSAPGGDSETKDWSSASLKFPAGPLEEECWRLQRRSAWAADFDRSFDSARAAALAQGFALDFFGRAPALGTIASAAVASARTSAVTTNRGIACRMRVVFDMRYASGPKWGMAKREARAAAADRRNLAGASSGGEWTKRAANRSGPCLGRFSAGAVFRGRTAPMEPWTFVLGKESRPSLALPPFGPLYFAAN
jgi:hypothetical protein